MAINAAYELPYTGKEVEELLGKVTSNETAIGQLEESVDGKVDKSDGKGLSSNDYTTEEKDKLNGIANGAEVNVQADWNDNDSSSDSFIKNKPTIPTKTSDLTNDSGFNVGTITGITMNGVSKGTSGVVNLGTVITSHQDISGKANRSDAIGTLSLSMNNTNYQITLSGTKVDGTAFTVANPIDLPLESVVVSGAYNNTTKKVVLTLQNGSTVEFSVADLVSGLQTEITSTNKLSADLISDGVTNKVVTSTEKNTWNNKSDFSGNYNDLTNKPTIPDAQIQSDWNQTNTSAKDYIKNKPNIPQGVVVDNALSSTSENPVQNKVINSALGNKVDSTNLATVATSGSYNDLSNKPTIPIVPTNVSDFTNDAGYVTSSDIPTKTSELTNDSGFITSHQDISGKADKSEMSVTTSGDTTTITLKSGTSATVINQHQDISGKVNTSDLSTVATSGNYNDLSNKPTIPDELSDLSDDSTHRLVTDTEKSTWNAKQNALTFDTTPTANSTNPVTSAGIKAYVDNATPTITMDDTPTSGSNNPVKSGGIYTALQGKQNTLTFDSTPTASSTNPITSGGVKTALDAKANQSTTYTKTEVDALFDDVAYLGDDDGQATTLDFDPQAYTVWNIPQTLGSSQQAQARANIGVVDVSGVNDGTNWTSITIGSTTKAIPSGGSSGDVNVIEGIKMNNTSLTPDANKVVDLGTVITSHQDISGKADKSEMGVSASGDQTTITLKSGTSATVINAHQSLTGKQDVLVSGTNIKTINNESLLGSGNITVSSGGGGSVTVDSTLSTSSTNPVQNAVITTALNGKEDASNKVTSLSSSSTDTQYPSAKCVYDIIGNIESLLAAI